MYQNHLKERFIRILPGRIRLDVAGLKGNESLALFIQEKIKMAKGLINVIPNINSGRALILFRPDMPAHQVIEIVEKYEMEYLKRTDRSEPAGKLTINKSYPETSGIIFNKASGERHRVPIPLLVSAGSFCVLGIKQIIAGKSALAVSPVSFYAAAGFSVLIGYSFLRNGFKKVVKDKKKSDFILGSSIFAISIMRENLVMLAGLGLLQYLNWKLGRPVFSFGNSNEHANYSREVRNYSEKTSKIGMLLAGTTLLLTRDPLRFLAVLFAVNPRPVTFSNEYTWSNAEYIAEQNGFAIPENGSLSQLVQTETILFEDTAQIFKEQNQDKVQCVTKTYDESKLWCLASSLLKKSHHSWKSAIIDSSGKRNGTIRTAFNVKEGNNGIQGIISNNHVCMGNMEYLKENGLAKHEYMFEARKWERDSHDLQYIFQDGECLGYFIRNGLSYTEAFTRLKKSMDSRWKVGVIQNSLNICPKELEKNGIDLKWLYMDKEEIAKRINDLRTAGKDVLAVKKESFHNYSSNNCPIPTTTFEGFKDLPSLMKFAKKMNNILDQQLSIAKMWNAAGCLLALPLSYSAPLIHAVADTFNLIFMIRGMYFSKKYAPDKNPELIAQQEVAAAISHTEESHTLAWHFQPVNEVLSAFSVNKDDGLFNEQIETLKKQFGNNQLHTNSRTPFSKTLLEQFKEFTTIVLLGASLLSIFTGGIVDGIAMACVLIVNALIGAVQEQKAERVVESLNQFQPPMCRVVRNGQQIELSGTELVPGDIVSFEPGDRIPADIRIIEAWNLEVNEAALTGESLPVEKSPDELEDDCPLAEQKNMLFLGTNVTRGKAVGVVVRTGMHTEIGYLMSLFNNDDKELTPLQQKVTSISKVFCKGAVVAGIFVFIAGLLRGIPILDIIATSVTLAASAIPQGLPIVITIALSAGVYRMLEKNVLIRKLSSLETLGRTTIICSDKTGTLTKNEMTVKAVSTIGEDWEVSGSGYEPIGAIKNSDEQKINASDHPDLEQLLKIGLLCNDSLLEKTPKGWVIQGDPTEGALLSLGAKAGKTKANMVHWIRYNEIPFDSGRGTMSVACHEEKQGKDCYIFTKGSIEAIMNRCNQYQKDGKVFPLTKEIKEWVISQNKKYAEQSLRVLAFAYRPIQSGHESEQVKEEELIFVGLTGMIDPPKQEVKKSVQDVIRLGVKPVMITGDHPITAFAIGKELNIVTDSAEVLSGMELDQLSEEQLVEKIKDVSVFARVSPEQKLRIVNAYQKLGHIVVMTGDGVNDSPAIKKADVGVSMGIAGTDVTKETADMVLKEDDFASIVDGIKQGRTIIGNIRKALGCLLTGNLSEILVTTTAVLIGLPIPLVPIQILLMNLLTDAIPATILAANPGNKNLLTKQQDIADRSLFQKIAVRGLLLSAGVVGIFAYSLSAGKPLAIAQTMAFATLVAGQLVQTFSWRQEGTIGPLADWKKDQYFIMGLGISWLALGLVMYIPPLASVFQTAPLTLGQWLPPLLVAGSVPSVSKMIQPAIERHLNHVNDGKPKPALQPVI